MTQPTIYFRADGNAQMGLGHIFRSLALAETLAEVFDCQFIIRNPLPTLRQQILAICSKLIELPEVVSNLDAVETSDSFDLKEANEITDKYFNKNCIVVLDGYHFTTDYQQIIKDNGAKVVCIDDIKAYHFVADAVINHAGGLTSIDYSKAKNTKLYLGLKYALLRRPFQDAASNRTTVGKEENIFICLGGADPKNDTLEVLKKCESANFIQEIHLVLGSAYLHESALKEYLKDANLNVTLHRNLDALQMVALMKKCGTAITPPSTIAYEYLSVGGTLFLKVIADNQININRYFLTEGLAFSFDRHFSKVNSEAKDRALTIQKEQLDGKSRRRFLNIFLDLSNAFHLRNAKASDLQLYYDWANDPSVRKNSLQTAAIPLAVHKRWFQQKLDSRYTVMYIMELRDQTIGQLRFELGNDQATINYSIDNAHRGKGLGTKILQKGIAKLATEYPRIKEVVGVVKKGNIPSIKAFESLGFKPINSEEMASENNILFSKNIRKKENILSNIRL